MKIVATFAAMACCVSAAALAADLPSRRVPPVYVPPTAAFSWTGFYAGINAGYAFDGDASFALSGTDPLTRTGISNGRRPGFVSTRANGFSGGGQIGYNYELGNGFIPGLGTSGGGLVAGLEADAAYTDLSGVTTYYHPPGGPADGASSFHATTDFVGTVRGRLGIAFGNVLLFGTGGFAYGDVRENANYFTLAGVNNFSGAASGLRTGYAYGGGVEYAIPTSSVLNVFNSSAVTLKAEYLHYDLGTSTLVAPNLVGFGNAYLARIHTDGDLVRAGLNYKFDFAPAAPVVARY